MYDIRTQSGQEFVSLNRSGYRDGEDHDETKTVDNCYNR
jgi:hypothetical protein